MDFANILTALEREKQWLAEFIRLSHPALLLPGRSNTEDVNYLLDCRTDLMTQLTEIHTVLGTWIYQIGTDAVMTPQMLDDLRAVNSEIVRVANDLVELDEQILQRIEGGDEDSMENAAETTRRKRPAKMHIV